MTDKEVRNKLNELGLLPRHGDPCTNLDAALAVLDLLESNNDNFVDWSLHHNRYYGTYRFSVGLWINEEGERHEIPRIICQTVIEWVNRNAR